jgi:SRSO17 transposase
MALTIACGTSQCTVGCNSFVGRQYIGEIGKTDNGVVLLTTYLYDGVRKLALDVALYQHASCLAQGKADPKFVKKPDLALQLIGKCLKRGYPRRVTVIDAGYGNNTPFVKHLESRNLIYKSSIELRAAAYCLGGAEESTYSKVRSTANCCHSIECPDLGGSNRG